VGGPNKITKKTVKRRHAEKYSQEQQQMTRGDYGRLRGSKAELRREV
jgi:hypothetical protein